MNKPKFIIIHCSDSKWGSAAEITKWHKEIGLRTIGYHFVINSGLQFNYSKYNAAYDGYLEQGRKETEEGVHTLGYNDKSIGICLIGKSKFTEKQMQVVNEKCAEICKKYKIPVQNILGHCEAKSGKKEGKTCPNYNVDITRKAVQKLIIEAAE